MPPTVTLRWIASLRSQGRRAPLPSSLRTSPMSRQTSSLFSAALIGPALIGSVRKLDPRAMIRNPVMFVVEVVALLTTVLFARDLITGGSDLAFSGQIILWLWFTLIFANFAEGLAEGRGKAQA